MCWFCLSLRFQVEFLIKVTQSCLWGSYCRLCASFSCMSEYVDFYVAELQIKYCKLILKNIARCSLPTWQAQTDWAIIWIEWEFYCWGGPARKGISRHITHLHIFTFHPVLLQDLVNVAICFHFKCIDFLFFVVSIKHYTCCVLEQNQRADGIPGEANYFQKAEGQKSKSHSSSKTHQ